MKIEIEAEEIIEKVVSPHGVGSGRIYLPVRLVGKKIKIIVLKNED